MHHIMEKSSSDSGPGSSSPQKAGETAIPAFVYVYTVQMCSPASTYADFYYVR